MLKKISDIHIKIQKNQALKKLVLASASDEHSIDAVFHAYKKNIIIPVLVGNETEIKQICISNKYDFENIEIIHANDKQEAVKISVEMVRNGKADILMKGNVSSSILLKGVLNKEYGLKTEQLLSHFAIAELKNYHKLIGITDVAMNIAPDINEKSNIVSNAVKFLNKIGYKKPKVAVIAAVETVNEKMQATVDAAILSKMADRKQIPNCIIDGPLAFDNAMSKESAVHKGIDSDVAGDADILLMPNIEAGNVLYKSLTYTGAKIAAILLGASAPIVLTSRSDSEETKLNSIILAAL
jgi:phosphate butyryltransferase